MRVQDLVEARHGLSESEAHTILEFIYQWLSGRWMTAPIDSQVGQMWEKIHNLFPPKVAGAKRLYRLVTLPIAAAEKKQLNFRPAQNSISSWSSTLTGIDAVMDVARDIAGEKDEAGTTRLAIRAPIPAEDIYATPASLKKAFLTLSHDYFEKYPEVVTKREENGQIIHTTTNVGYIGNNDIMSMDDVDYMQSVVRQRGGYQMQYEHVVKSPPMIAAEVMRIYRLGTKTLRWG